MAGIDDNITQLMDFAASALASARAASGRISTFIPSVGGGDLGFTDKNLPITKPVALSDLLQVDNSAAKFDWIDAETEAKVDQYFPEINGCLRYSPEEWLCGIITGQQPFGLSKEVFEAVWHESRDREYRSRNSAVEQIRAEFSQRGFRAPPGAMYKAIMQVEERASDAIGEVNRAQTIKSAEIKLDLLKFAESEAIKLKLGIFQAITDYYRVLISLPDNDIEASRMKVAAYGSFNDSMANYHRVQLGFEELRLQAASLRMNGKLDKSRIQVSAVDGSRNAAFGQSTNAFANTAAQAAGAAGTINANIVTG